MSDQQHRIVDTGAPEWMLVSALALEQAAYLRKVAQEHEEQATKAQKAYAALLTRTADSFEEAARVYGERSRHAG